MDFSFLIYTAISLFILNVAVYLFFQKRWMNSANAGLKFLTLNVFKDVAWAVFWLFNTEKTPPNLYTLMAVYAVFSFFVYRKVIQDLNKN